MELTARLPDPLSGEGDMAHNWHVWKEDFEIYLKVTGYEKESTENRAYLLRNQIGKVGRDYIEKIMAMEPFDKNDINELLDKLERHFNPSKSEIEERYEFFKTTRFKYETIENHIRRLTEMSKSCNFGDMTESLIRDKAITDIVDATLRKKCFEADNLDLEKFLSIYHSHRALLNKNKQGRPNDNRGLANSNYEQTRGQQFSGVIPKNNCWRCRQKHPFGQCPAWGHRCLKCNQLHHYPLCCRTPNANNDESGNNTRSDIQTNARHKVDKRDNVTKKSVADPVRINSPTPNLYPTATLLPDLANRSIKELSTSACNNPLQKQDECTQKRAPSPRSQTKLVKDVAVKTRTTITAKKNFPPRGHSNAPAGTAEDNNCVIS